MSNHEISMRRAAEEARLAEVRRREAEARAAERARLRKAHTEGRIRTLDARAQAVTARLDLAAAGLPDLALRAQPMPALPDDATPSQAVLDHYAAQLEAAVQAYENQAAQAIAQATELLRRRQATAQAWRNAAQLQGRIGHLHTHCVELARRSGEPLAPLQLPGQPAPEAELEAVQAHEQALQALLADWQATQARLDARRRTLAQASSHAGAAVSAQQAHVALDAADQREREAAVAALRAHLATEKARLGLAAEDLGSGLRELLAHALERTAQGDARDLRPEATVWLAREAAQREGVRRAAALLQQVPEGVNDSAELRRRWEALAAQLQRVMNAMDPMTPSLEREHTQLAADAQTQVNLMLARADWAAAITAAGCELVERDDGLGLLVIDPAHPQTWLEVEEFVDESGGYAVALELKTTHDAVIADEEAVTADVCRKLKQVAGDTAPKVEAQSEVLERKARITRARRPSARRLQALQQPLPTGR